MGVFPKLSKLDGHERVLVLLSAFVAVVTPAVITLMALDQPGMKEPFGNKSSDGLSASQQEEIAARLKQFMAGRNDASALKETSVEGGTRYEFNVNEAFVSASYDGDTNNCPRFKVVLKPEAGSYSTTQSLTVCPK